MFKELKYKKAICTPVTHAVPGSGKPHHSETMTSRYFHCKDDCLHLKHLYLPRVIPFPLSTHVILPAYRGPKFNPGQTNIGNIST